VATLPDRFVLRRLPLSARISVTVFLLSVGLGYLAALVQLHYQHAKKGELMPGAEDTVRIFHDALYGRPDESKPTRPVGKVEALITADRTLKIGASGQMRTTFDTESEDWKESIKQRMKDKGLSEDEATKVLMNEREGEFLAVLKWVQSGGPKKAYDDDDFPLPDDWKKDQPITAAFVRDGGKDVKIASLLKARCVVCHGPNGAWEETPFDKYELLKKFIPDLPAKPTAPARQPSMSITKLAQTSHVHMLGFAMLYGLTGMLLAFTTYPAVVRLILCPLPLVVQVVDIACWWLARLDAPYGVWAAKVIPITGGIIAAGVLAHILLTIFDLYGVAGKLVLVLLLGGAGAGGFVYLRPVIEKEIREEKPQPAEVEKKESGDPAKK
jgi:hypothetical protein